MALKLEEIRKYLARNVRLSICFEDGYYHNYLMISDIPEHKYDDLYVYGIGMVSVEFSRDIYSMPKEPEGVVRGTKDDVLEPALEIVLYQNPRDIARSVEGKLLFRDLKPYLQIFGNISVVDRDSWSNEIYKYRSEIPEKYDDRYVYGIGMEDNQATDILPKKRLVIVLSEKAREE